MKYRFTAEQPVDISDVSIQDIVVGDRKTDVEIGNFLFAETNGHFNLHFSCGFDIQMDERGIRFRRTVERPDHDHDDEEDLMIHQKNGSLLWSRDWLHEKDHDIFYLPFGPRKEGE